MPSPPKHLFKVFLNVDANDTIRLAAFNPVISQTVDTEIYLQFVCTFLFDIHSLLTPSVSDQLFNDL